MRRFLIDSTLFFHFADLTETKMTEYDLDTLLSGFGNEDILSTPSSTTSGSETDSGIGATPPMDPLFDDMTIDVNNLGENSNGEMSLPFFTFVCVDFPPFNFDLDFEKFLAQDSQVRRKNRFFSFEFAVFAAFAVGKRLDDLRNLRVEIARTARSGGFAGPFDRHVF